MKLNRIPIRSLLVAAAAAWMAVCPQGTGKAEVYHSRESALRLAFPEADNIEKRELFLSSAEAADVERLAGVKLPSRLVTVYVGTRDARVVGYAFIETHQVRSLPETVLLVVYPDGRAKAVHMLAFHEPPEYAPTERWLGQFAGRPLDRSLSLRGGVDGITGATLTANAITASVRRILAVFQVAVGAAAAGGAGNTGEISEE
jgi:hypothetical protein